VHDHCFSTFDFSFLFFERTGFRRVLNEIIDVQIQRSRAEEIRARDQYNHLAAEP
jgi:hypothetical protein